MAKQPPKLTRIRKHRGKEYKVTVAHTIADVMPWLPEEDLDKLAEDIKANGQVYAIRRNTADGKIIDGRNRELACMVASVQPQYLDEEWTEEEIYNFIVSTNMQRRATSASQRAIMAASFLAVKPGTTNETASRREIAQFVGISERYVTAARRILKLATSQTVSLVREGFFSLEQAESAMALPHETQAKIATSNDPVKSLERFLREIEEADTEPEQPEPKTEPVAVKHEPLPEKPKPEPKVESSEPKEDKTEDHQPEKTHPEPAKEEPKPQPVPEVKIDPFASTEDKDERNDDTPGFHWETMPNADGAQLIAGKMVTWISEIESLKKRIEKEFPIESMNEIGNRIDAAQFVALLNQMKQTLQGNIPTHVCPNCCGTGHTEDEQTCKYCNGYGIVDKRTYESLKVLWSKTRARLLKIRGEQ